MTVLRSASGGAISLGDVIGRGGEGTVYAIKGKPGIAAKIYKPELAQERNAKIAAMTAAKWEAQGVVAFPIDALFNSAGTFSGFSMPLVGGHRAVHELYSPAGRKNAFPKATYPFLVRCVLNIARAVARVHATGCVIGDVNHSGILVSDTATVTLIDADSFQVSSGGIVYPCKVGVQEFTPPELQGKSLDKVFRTENHDGFGLAVLLFYTLFMGRHPYAGRYRGAGEMPLDRAIKEFRFAYSNRRSETEMEPPPHVPRLADVPIKLADAFESSFGRPGSAGAPRPSAKDWVSLLTEAEADLVRCPAGTGHHHFRQASSCPWCRMEQAYPGFQAFAPIIPTMVGSAPINLDQLINAVRNVTNPGEAPSLTSLMAVRQATPPSPESKEFRERIARRLSAATIFASIGLGTFAFPAIDAVGFSAVAIGAVCAFSAYIGKNGKKTFDRRVAQAEREWSEKASAFASAAGNEVFNRIRADAQILISQVQQLDTEEQQRLRKLESEVRQSQLTRHLESHSIENAKIKGLGTALKLTLRSYNIETAADVGRSRIERVHGFGPTKAQALVTWRNSVEAKFRFDPQRGVDPRDVATVKTEIAKRRSDGETRLGRTLADLKRASASALALRSGNHSDAQAAYAALEQARADQHALRLERPEKGRLMLITTIGLLLSVIPHIVLASRWAESVPPAIGDAPLVQQPSKQAPDAVARPNARNTPPTQPTESSPKIPEVSRNAPLQGQPLGQSSGIANIAPELPPPREIETMVVSPLEPPLLDLNNKADAARVQEQLKALGFLRGPADGIWGRQSRAALQAFRLSNSLGTDDTWDAETQERLLDYAW